MSKMFPSGVVAAGIDKRPAPRAFHSADGGIFLFDTPEHAAAVIDGHAEVIETARIARRAEKRSPLLT